MNCLIELNHVASEMNEAELQVLVAIARRLSAGRKTYGPLNPRDGRDWRKEMREEIYDWMVYDAIEGVS